MMRRTPLNRLRTSGMHKDTVLYEDSKFVSLIQPVLLEQKMQTYRDKAMNIAREQPPDRAVVYAVFEYSENGNTIISASFMTKCLKYDNYSEMAAKLVGSCRFFFLRGRKGTKDE